MDLRQYIGRLFFVGIPGPRLDEEGRHRLEILQPGGIVLFRRNLGTPEEIAALAAALHALPSRPLVAIDHEGGRVQRLAEPFTPFPAAALIGRTRDATLAHRIGRAMADELASVGIDLNFAPVLDVDSNPANPIIGDRAFGSDPLLVRDLGIALMQGLLAGSVIPCGKHFPGHGDTATDSHRQLPVVHRSRTQLERVELLPFRAAVAAGIPVLMTAHVLYPALDADHPATLSRRVLTDLLREELRFGGAIATDDLEMRAITAHQTIGQAAVASVAAGADMLLICEHVDQAVEAAAALERGIDSGLLDGDHVVGAAGRIERLRSFIGERPRRCALPNPGHRALVEELHNA